MQDVTEIVVTSVIKPEVDRKSENKCSYINVQRTSIKQYSLENEKYFGMR